MHASPRSRSRISGFPRRAVRPRVEGLESRLALSASPAVALAGGVLSIQGTPGPDRIQVLPTARAGVVRVVLNGKAAGDFGPATLIDVRAGGGNDSVVVDPRITLPSRLDGGEGNDRLRGGSGPNALSGGGGDDTLVVTPTRDTFDGGSGRTTTVRLASLGVIQVGPSASGAGLRRLSATHRLMPLQVAGPMVVGPADLRNRRVVELLKNSYAGGHSVAVAGGTEADADALARLVGDPRPVAFSNGVKRADLVAFRKVSEGSRGSRDVSVLLPTVASPIRPGRFRLGIRAIREGDRSYLSKVFTPTPVLPAVRVGDDPQGDLTKLSVAYNSSKSYSDPNYGQTQVYDTVYSIRSFTNQVDFYYLTQSIQATSFIGDLGQIGSGGHVRFVPNAPRLLADPLILQPTPLDNPGTTSYTTGVNESFGGSIGWNEDSGFNASISGGVSLEDGTTTTVPPVSISYIPNLSAGATNWIFVSNNGNSGQMTAVDSWIWQVPFKAYSPGTTTLPFMGYAVVGPANAPEDYQVEDLAAAPLPFGDVFQLAQPVVTSVSAPTVAPGAKFSIAGSAFYPALVESVLIGGQALDPANFTVVGDGQIQVVAPTFTGAALKVVVKTTQGLSNDDVTINIVGTTQVSVQTQPISAVAGQAFANVKLASVTDSDTNANPSAFNATINWGDGSSTLGTITSTGPGTYDLSGAHAYASAGTYTFNVQVTDPGGAKASASGTATVSAPANNGPQNLTAQPVSAVAGQAFSNVTVATFTSTDPSGSPADFAATIGWGDGSTSNGTIVSTGAGTFGVLAGHTFATAGTYALSFQVTGPGGSKATTVGSAAVSADASGGPQNLVAKPVSAKVGIAFSNVVLATFLDLDPGVVPSDFTAGIVWGDGISTPVTTVTTNPSGGFIVLGTHLYNVAGVYTYQVQVVDAKGRKATGSGTVTVTS